MSSRQKWDWAFDKILMVSTLHNYTDKVTQFLISEQFVSRNKKNILFHNIFQ